MKYATPYDKKKMARAMGVALPISTKKTVELCNFIRGREVSKAVRLLEYVIDEKIAVPFRRYAKGGTGHKPGIGPGRYPKKVCLEVIKLLRQTEANARVLGLDTAGLVISSMVTKKGAQSFHFGRQRRIRMKRTHVEIVVTEGSKSDMKKPVRKAAASAAAEKNEARQAIPSEKK